MGILHAEQAWDKELGKFEGGCKKTLVKMGKIETWWPLFPCCKLVWSPSLLMKGTIDAEMPVF